MARITFNHNDYETADLSPEARAYLEALKLTEAEIQLLSSLQKIAIDAQALYTKKLTEILERD